MDKLLPKIYTGAVREEQKEKDYIYEALGSAPLTQEEWEKGYDVEKELGLTIPFKNQQSSYSCVGQAWSIYWAVKNAIKTGRLDIISAKAIYSKISLGYARGAYIRDGGKLLTEYGALPEELVKSFRDNGLTDESFMIDKSWETEALIEMASNLKAEDYYLVTGLGIDAFARAIKDGKGMVAGVEGNNNGTWSSNEPKRPADNTPQNDTWGHALFFGKFGIDEKGKYIATPNSWGTRNQKDKLHPDDWQKLREDWFINSNRYMFNPWIAIPKTKNMETNETAKILKDKNSKAVGIWLPAISEAVLKSYALNMGKVLPYKADGSLDWEKAIDGEFEYKK